MTKPIRFLVLFFVGILAWTPIAFAQGIGSVCVWQENVDDDFAYLGVVDIFDHSGSSAAELYSYGTPYGASYNGSTPPALSGISQLFVVQTNDGDGPSLFFVHDEPVDGSGGTARTNYFLPGGAAAVLVRDDPGEIPNYIPNQTWGFDHFWAPCCTDGGVIGTLDGSWTLDVWFAVAPGGIGLWQVTSATGAPVPLVLEPLRRAQLRPCERLDIDLKPGSNPNCVKLGSGGLTSVAILTTEDFDALMLDESTILFGGAESVRCAVEDVGADVGYGDGDLDLVCKFRKHDVTWPGEGTDCGLVEMTASDFDGYFYVGSAIACLAGEPTCEAGMPAR